MLLRDSVYFFLRVLYFSEIILEGCIDNERQFKTAMPQK